MVSTPAQLLQTSLLWLWRGGGVWGVHGKHTRSTAADKPALLPDYKVTWLWGGGGGWGIRITKQHGSGWGGLGGGFGGGGGA